MKKQYWYILLLLCFTGMVSFVVLRYQHKELAQANAFYTLLPRKGIDADNLEWLTAKKNADKLLAKVRANSNDFKSSIALANAYITESRISGNIAYYDNAAMKTVDHVLSKDANNYEAWLLKALLQLSQHHFTDGLLTAEAAAKMSPNHAFVYGLLVDANVELGNYSGALEAADKMVSIRPDLRSYSRIAYLREIFGDYPGAVNAMRLAVDAGTPSEESTEWCRTQLGRLYENMGDITKAIFQYQLTLAARPGYAPAFAGLARIASHEKKYDSAVYYYQQATGFTNDIGTRQSLAIAYQNAGQAAKANALNKEVINEMNLNTKQSATDPTIGHYSDKELAYAYLQNNNLDKALDHALAEYNRRPKNIDINETLAWVYYKRNEYSKALLHIDAAMITHSMNPVCLCTAGLIYAKTRNSEKAAKMLKAGLKNNAVMPEDIKKEALQSYKSYNP